MEDCIRWVTSGADVNATDKLKVRNSCSCQEIGMLTTRALDDSPHEGFCHRTTQDLRVLAAGKGEHEYEGSVGSDRSLQGMLCRALSQTDIWGSLIRLPKGEIMM